MKKVKFKIDVVIDDKLNYNNNNTLEYGIKDIIKFYLYNAGLSSRISIKSIEIGNKENK